MEEEWHGEELRAFRAWLDEHGFKPTREGAPGYMTVRRNGELAYRSVSEVWKEDGRLAAIVMSISRSGKIGWKTLIYRKTDGELLQRLQLNEARRAEVESGVSGAAVGCPSWLPCPSACDICTFACGTIVGDAADAGIIGCISNCSRFGNPWAAAVCGAACSALIGIGEFVLETEGCPAGCDAAGFC
jgi:hypothetical protein